MFGKIVEQVDNRPAGFPQELERFSLIPSIDRLRKQISHVGRLRTSVALLAAVGVLSTIILTTPSTSTVQARGRSLPPNPINFIYQDVNTSWLAVHGTFSFSGSDRGIDTVEVSRNGVYNEAFQPIEDPSCYPEISRGYGISEVVWGMVANPAKGKGAIAIGVSDNTPGYAHPKGGEVVDLANPGDLSKRICLTSKGLPDTVLTYDNSFVSYTQGTDAQGDYLEQSLKNAINPTQNGRYRLRLSAIWNSMGSWVKQQAYKLFLPINLQGYPS